MHENLRKLKELTFALDQSKNSCENNFLWSKKNGSGTSFTFGLFENGKISVKRTFVSQGACTSKHKHASKVWLFVYEGNIMVYSDDVDIILKEGDVIYLEPFRSHLIRAETDSWLIFVSVPAEEGCFDAA